MEIMKYALERGGDKPLEISWEGNYKNVKVRLNGNLIGEIPSRKELLTRQIFQLPDKTDLKVQLEKIGAGWNLRVLRNDKPLPGSIFDPVYMNAVSFSIIYLIAGVNIVLGLIELVIKIESLQGLNIMLGFIALVMKIESLPTLGIGIIAIAIGFIFLVLGFFTQRRSRLALIVALIIHSLDCVLALFSATPFVLSFVYMLYMMVKPGTSWVFKAQNDIIFWEMIAIAILLFVSILFRYLFLLFMVRGIGAINELKKETPLTVS
jgi:hypothetical protein